MPDLTTEYAWSCETNREWETTVPSSRGGATYTVRWERDFSPKRTTEFHYSCTCKGFEIRRTCSHVRKVEAGDPKTAGRCSWDSRWEAGEPMVEVATEEDCCPRCGGPVFGYTYGA